MSRILLINADDFGWTDGHNLGIVQANRSGIVNRASLLCNGFAFDQAVELAHSLAELKIGVHLSLNEVRPLLPARLIPNLIKPDGYFYDSVLTLVRFWFRGRLSIEECTMEWRSQIERALQAGIKINHLDSHKHVHLIPPLLEVAIMLAMEYNISYIRLPFEALSLAGLQRRPVLFVMALLAHSAKFRLENKGIRFSDQFIGTSTSGAMTLPRLERAIRKSRPGLVEIMVHPAKLTQTLRELQKSYAWARRYQFEHELAALCHPSIQKLFQALTVGG